MDEKKSLSIDRAAFLLLRVKKAFKKKKSQRKSKDKSGIGNKPKTKKPLLRSRTLPSIVGPAFNILQSQIDSNYDPKFCSDLDENCKCNNTKSQNSLQVPQSGCSGFYNSSNSSSNENLYDFRRKSTMTQLLTRDYSNYDTLNIPNLTIKAPNRDSFELVFDNDTNYSDSITSAKKSPIVLFPLTNFFNQEQIRFRDTIPEIRKQRMKQKLQRSISIDSMIDLMAEMESFNEKKPPLSLSPIRQPDQKTSPVFSRKSKLQRNLNELLINHNYDNNNDYRTCCQGQENRAFLNVDDDDDDENDDNENNDNDHNGYPQKPIMDFVNIPSNFFAIIDRTNKLNIANNFKISRNSKSNLVHSDFNQTSQYALITAVEHGNLEKAKYILESSETDLNSLTSEGLTLLDIAVLSNNKQMTKMLIDFGAKEGYHCKNLDKLRSHLDQLQTEIQLKLHELGASSTLYLNSSSSKASSSRSSISSIISGSYSSSMAGCTGGDVEKQIFAWSRRSKFIQRLINGLEVLQVPLKPSTVKIDVLSISKISMRIYESTHSDLSITTKFKVEWSARSDFNPIVGQCETIDAFLTLDLTHGRRYYFRVCSGNLKGFSHCCYSTPSSIVPSSWQDVHERPSRFDGKMEQLEQLVQEVKQFRPYCDIFSEQNSQKARLQKKKTAIKQLFTAASKFQKNLRRGVYLTTIFYNEDKVLVTNEDFLPTLEIDEIYPGSVQTDLHWLMKVSCSWKDVKSLKTDMEKNSASNLHHFRAKILSAAIQMQSALNTHNLGEFYYKPLKDSQGTMVFSTISHVQSPKAIMVMNSRWMQVSKLQKKTIVADSDSNLSDILLNSLADQIRYHAASRLKISRGLYVSYLKLQSSVDLLQVVVPVSTPNILPHCKIRDNPHVTAEEWTGLRNQLLGGQSNNSVDSDDQTEQQKSFTKSLVSAIKCLLKYMTISKIDSLTHRLYDFEVIELSGDISLIVICPSYDQSCSVPGQREFLLQRNDLINIPIQVFEMIHLNTYENNIISKYARLSCVLELDQIAANHLHREAFSASELASAKERLAILRDLQTKLTSIWKSVRWLIDIITFAREKNSLGISLKNFLENDKSSNESIDFLQLPIRESKTNSKNGCGRGSWPGPSNTNSTAGNTQMLMGEFSKSEKILPLTKESSYQNLKNSMGVVSKTGGLSLSSPPFTPVISTIRPVKSSSSIKLLTTANTDAIITTTTFGLQTTAATIASTSKSMTNLSSLTTTGNNETKDNDGFKVPKIDILPSFDARPSISAGIVVPIQVYAAYETHSKTQNSLNMQINSETTTTKQIVETILRQLVRSTNGSRPNDCCDDYCLVILMGVRERILADDFRPGSLLVANSPWWKNGRFFVRKKDCVLAALETNNYLKRLNS